VNEGGSPIYSGDVEFSQEYGLPGQDQEGIDIYVRHRSSGRYSVWQCKRYQEFKAGLVRDAVEEFLKGEWVAKTEEFVLCITAPTKERDIADEIERQRERLHKENIVFTPLGIIQLSNRLKDQPELVHDFFGVQAVKDFCGEDAATKLSRRKLTPEDVVFSHPHPGNVRRQTRPPRRGRVCPASLLTT
jgi:hypothetical protein